MVRFPHLLLAATLATPTAATAIPMTIELNGTITEVGSALSGGGLSVGDPVFMRFTYDTAATDGDPAPDRGEYPLAGFSIDLGGWFNAIAGSGTLEVLNDKTAGSATLPGDGLTALGWDIDAPLLNGRTLDLMQFGLRRENDLGHLWMDDLPPDESDWAGITLEDLNRPDWRWLQFSYSPTENLMDAQIRWEVTGAAGIPEPATALLLGAGLIGLASHRKGKRS